MVTVRSYLRRKDGSFQPVEEVTRRPSGPDYDIEGAVELTVNGTQLIGQQEWDYVVLLWASIINALEELCLTGAGRAGFPDQPLNLVFQWQDPQRVLVRYVEGRQELRRATAAREELLAALCAAGERFFARMAELRPKEAPKCQDERERLARLRERDWPALTEPEGPPDTAFDDVDAPLPAWHPLSGELRRLWAVLFRTVEQRWKGPDLTVPCPLCGRRALHRYYLLQRPLPPEDADLREVARGLGQDWKWCAACGAVTCLPDALVPEWWTVDWGVRAEEVGDDPGALELARRRHARQRRGAG